MNKFNEVGIEAMNRNSPQMTFSNILQGTIVVCLFQRNENDKFLGKTMSNSGIQVSIVIKGNSEILLKIARMRQFFNDLAV